MKKQEVYNELVYMGLANANTNEQISIAKNGVEERKSLGCASLNNVNPNNDKLSYLFLADIAIDCYYMDKFLACNYILAMAIEKCLLEGYPLHSIQGRIVNNDYCIEFNDDFNDVKNEITKHLFQLIVNTFEK